ncbi:MAG: guanitoxin biosynthesis heme-dependent pre-guanitoxin N-hydroxylase GntA [Oxalicibacterium faecigallinarum]|uniref:guanitoxin biosynthesis heme-dependent pre-guanitoxin N-hydroxylase GntA n=1 Tax=Oxalicibacterium faecigallinarum TaxID=573741 RepID=UPI002807699A|nr:guanitoxin biosynthesis heme-dependent pre-guanitoxin N-hydroxylase GntA [Oxalicibacterium faecigallinarum]MDQ7970740.1 guanitoxin biosynthesis heme-dependent pre-guanitoxin N-hydroxylase GntA [Oxalicibacterium faecigallinarum]
MQSETLSRQKNPFDSRDAIESSNYAAFIDKKLVAGDELNEKPEVLLDFIHDSFRSLVLNPQFSCVGAKSAIQQGGYRIGHYDRLGSKKATAGLAHDLFHFLQEQPQLNGEFSTFVATFSNPIIESEQQFEQLLWQQLQQLHEIDAPLHAWDPAVSDDPDNPHFAFSFSEHSFFVVGMHPAASRYTRRFAWPTLVFNLHAQFERLREEGRFERMQQVIRSREEKLQGFVNQSLSEYGTMSDARQYAGRVVEQEWKCPFSKKASESGKKD